MSDLYTNPPSVGLLAGANPEAIRFSGGRSGVNYVYFTKWGDGSFYSNLPPLVLTINKNYNTPLTLIETQQNLPVNPPNSTYTIALTLPPSLYPLNQVTMSISLSSYVGLTTIPNLTTISFYPTQGTAYVSLYVNDSTLWVVGRTTNLIITPMDDTYVGSGVVRLDAVVAAVSSVPTFALSTTTVNKKQATFSLTCS